MAFVRSTVDDIVTGRVGGSSLDRLEVSPTTVIVIVVIIVRRPMMAVARSLQAARCKQVVAPCAPCRVDVGVVGGGRMAPVEWGWGKAMRALLPHNQDVMIRRRRRNDDARRRLCTRLSHPICDDKEEEEEQRRETKTVYLSVTLISLPPLPAPARDVLAMVRRRPAT